MPCTRAYGRSLADFGALLPAEKALLEASRTGKPAAFGWARPTEPNDAIIVRAEFVRFLGLGGDENAPVHEKGVQLLGAWLEGELSFESAVVCVPLSILHCRLSKLDIRHAKTRNITMTGSLVSEGIDGRWASCEGGVFLENGFEANDTIDFTDASILGPFKLGRAKIESPDEEVLALNRTKITGNVYLSAGFTAVGEVNAMRAVVGGSLVCSDGRFQMLGGYALSCDGIRVDGSVLMDDDFHAEGEVRLHGAMVSGTIECSGTFRNPGGPALTCDSATAGKLLLTGTFEGRTRLARAAIAGDVNFADGSFDAGDDDAIVADRMTAGSALFFRGIREIRGSVSMMGVYVQTMCDDGESWQLARGRLALDGFRYGALVGSAPRDAKTRIAWLKAQKPEYLKEGFRPQPWEQLISALRQIGHPEAAKSVAIAKQDALKASGEIRPAYRPFHRLYGLLVGYGYRPGRVLIALAIIWFAWGGLYEVAVREQTVPYLQSKNLNDDWKTCADERSGRAIDKDRHFSPWAFSADVLVPVIKFNYAERWTPAFPRQCPDILPYAGYFQIAYWLEIAFGWIGGIALLAAANSLMKRD